MRERCTRNKLVVDVISGSIVSSGIGHAEILLKGNRSPNQVSPPGGSPRLVQRRWKWGTWYECRIRIRMQWICGTALLDDVILAIDDVMPWAPMPVVVTA